MQATSFRDILMGFLEENEPVSPLKTQGISETPLEIPLEGLPFFSVEFASPRKPQPHLHSVYPAPPKSKRPRKSAKTAKPAEPEWTVSVSALCAEDLGVTEEWIRLGAWELAEGISFERLKAAHRRFVKLYHPDRDASPQARECFLKAQGLYEKLTRALIKYKTSGSARGNESASAEGSQHQDAA